jgi:predicted flap endonuclease-1-like 5' DNA nuclease
MKTKVTFILTAEIVGDAKSGILVGEFNNWDKDHGFSLKKSKGGALTTTISLKAGKSYQYRYLLDDGRWVNDTRATIYTHEHQAENCVVDVPIEPEIVVEDVETKTAKAKSSTDKKDDLTKIEGIGKKIAELLIADDIDSFQKLSETSTKKLKEVLNAAGNRFKIYDPSSWAKQAKLAMNSKWDELKKLQIELKKSK